MNDSKKRLGRGLEGMLGGAKAPARQVATTQDAKASAASSTGAASTGKASGEASNFFLAPIEEVHPNRAQPRTKFEDTALDELAASIREHGVLEPILVGKRKEGGYEIIAGERRWRAAQRAALHQVPVFVRELSLQAAFEAAIVENVQREDLNAVETARAFARLIEEFGHTQEGVAQKIGKDRSTVANALRLLKLPKTVLEQIENGELSEGHGRALLQASSPAVIQKLAARAIAEGWSVRETERRAKLSGQEPPPKKEKSANVKDLETRLAHSLGSKVAIEDNAGKGYVKLDYNSLDELDRLIERMMRSAT